MASGRSPTASQYPKAERGISIIIYLVCYEFIKYQKPGQLLYIDYISNNHCVRIYKMCYDFETIKSTGMKGYSGHKHGELCSEDGGGCDKCQGFMKYMLLLLSRFSRVRLCATL